MPLAFESGSKLSKLHALQTLREVGCRSITQRSKMNSSGASIGLARNIKNLRRLTVPLARTGRRIGSGGAAHVLPITNRRYSRLKICATVRASELTHAVAVRQWALASDGGGRESVTVLGGRADAWQSNRQITD
ncbi:hypothetical protein SBV1_1000011 [Verrucomicrobia bacterium]|nr:hypothetical protein SBV1_1000011 [Verrucomicrobiota bacterium]